MNASFKPGVSMFKLGFLLFITVTSSIFTLYVPEYKGHKSANSDVSLSSDTFENIAVNELSELNLKLEIETRVPIRLPDTLHVRVGEEFIFEIGVSEIPDNVEINGFSFQAWFDSDILNVDRASILRGEIVGGLFEANITSEGKIIVMAASSTAYEKAGNVIYIALTAKEAGVFDNVLIIERFIMGMSGYRTLPEVPFNIVLVSEQNQ
jgi:hypothetical protein